MPPATPAIFPTYDPDIAASMLEVGSDGGGGLPAYLKLAVVDVGPGYLACEVPVTQELLNRFGAAHGGVVSALFDHALGAVCVPVVPPGWWPATSEFKLNLMAPARVGPMRAEARILTLSTRTAVVRVDVANNDRLVAAGQGTVTILSPKEPGHAGNRSL